MTRWLIGIAGIVLVLAVGCGGGRSRQPVKGQGEIVLQIDWRSSRSRLIPEGTARVDITITGDGLTTPLLDSIDRPSTDTAITRVYVVPVGFKEIAAQAKDTSGQVLASGKATVTVLPNQRATAEVVLVSPTAKTVLVRTFRGSQPAPPAFLAFQDGDGPWQSVPLSGAEYSLPVTDPSGRYGVAIVSDNGGSVTVSIFHATVNELPVINHASAGPPVSEQPTVTVSGTLLGINEGDQASVFVNGASTYIFVSFPNPPYDLSVPPGIYDIIALRASVSPESPRNVNKVFIRRNVAIQQNTTVDIDFNDPSTTFAPETRSIVINGVMTDEYVVGNVSFLSDLGTTATLAEFGSAEGTIVQTQFAGIPVDRQIGKDIHQLFVFATQISTGSTELRRSLIRFFRASANQTVNLPEQFSSPQVTLATATPYLRLTARWSAYPGSAQAYHLGYAQQVSFGKRRRLSRPPLSLRPLRASLSDGRRRQTTTAGTLVWNVWLTNEWFGNTTEFTYTLPDFSTLSGWSGQWGLSNAVTSWDVTALSSNRTVADLLEAEQSPSTSSNLDGLEVRRSTKSGLF